MVTFDDYLGLLHATLKGIDRDAFQAMVAIVQHTYDNDKVIYVCGNGGSAATATHMVNDLVKAPAEASGRRPIRAIGLADNMSLVTAYANDIAYAQIFSKQIEALARPGDLLVAISGSGNSPNVLEAAKTARAQGLNVVGMTGFDGGALKDIVDVHLNAPCACIAVAEDAHLILEHALVEVLKTALGGRSAACSGGCA